MKDIFLIRIVTQNEAYDRDWRMLSISRPTLLKKFYNFRVGVRFGSNLIEKHAAFLELVKGHGTGSVLLEPTQHEQVAILRLANIERKNAISGRMMFDLANIIDKITDDDSRVYSGLIVTGDGNIFCAGADFGLAKEVLTTPEHGSAMSGFMSDALNALRSSDIVSVCLLNGPAVGGGAEITTSCDFRLMTPASYATFIHARMGVTPGWGAVGRLMSIVGRANALKLLGKLPLAG